jgi:serine/threonine protein kinase
MHSRNFVHRDLKPNNIAVGVGQKAGIVYLIDFGLAKQFRDPNTHMHIPYINMHGLTGTAVFASIHSHIGWELGRRDDLESLAYILIYFLRGSLPWQSCHQEGCQDVKEDFVLKLKQQINVHDLCHNLPVEFRKFLEYARSLSFDDKPDYNYLYDLFDGLLSHSKDSSFDWSVDGGQSGGEDRHSSGIRRTG